MADPLDSQHIARRSFEVGRRGYEQQEVRAFLHEVSSLVERLQRETAQLRERAERAEARLGLSEEPDEAMLLEVLGEETTRVLTSAREAAAEIRTKAEGAAERIISEATAEAAETRSQAVRDADRRLAEAATESEAILAAARSELDRRSAVAEAAAAEIKAAAATEAQALRDAGQQDLERLQAEGEAQLEAARTQGRDMVAEAQAVRERVLRDLAVRRKKARQQVEKLNAGRERLLRAYEVVRRTIDEATQELSTSLSDARLAADAAARRIEEEPEPTIEQLDEEARTAGLIDLPAHELDDTEDDHPGPFSGEVPAVTSPEPDATAVSSEDARGPAPEDVAPEPAGPAEPAATDGDDLTDRAVEVAPAVDLEERRGRKSRRRGKGGFEGLPAGELTRVEPPAEGEGVRILAEPAAPEAADTGAVEADTEPPRDAAPEPEQDAPPSDAAPPEPEPSPDAAPEPESAEVPAEDAEAGTEAASDAGAEATDEEGSEGTSPAVDDLFARLRAEQSEGGEDAEPEADSAPAAEAAEPQPVEPEAEAEPQPEPEADAAAEVPAAFVERDAALEPLDKELGRRLKRALADEQNEVLDLLRRAKPKGVDDLLPSPDDHAARWAEVVSAVLADAAGAGATWAGGKAGSVSDLAADLAQTLTAPLRDRIDRSFVASDGNLDDVTDRVRALYREWKGQRLVDTSRHYAAAAYARGAFDALPKGAPVRWAIDPVGGPCPDCDDNVLGGTLVKGEEFPTGHPCAPAHPGCRCLVLAADA